MNMNKKRPSYKTLAVFVALVAVSVFAMGRLVTAYSGSTSGDVFESGSVKNVYFQVAEGTKELGEALLGAASRPVYYVYDYVNGLYVSGSQIFDSSANATLPGTLSVAGDTSLEEVIYKTSITSIASTLTTTLTAADSGKTFLIGGTTSTVILPATSSLATGVNYRFVVGSALTVSSTVVTVTGANEIEGTLIVAGAVVDCDAEDTITLGASVENIGDYFDIMWSGSKWLLGDSGALTATALACTAS